MEGPVIVVRLRRPGMYEARFRVAAEHLQAVMDLANRHFGDPNKIIGNDPPAASKLMQTKKRRRR